MRRHPKLPVPSIQGWSDQCKDCIAAALPHLNGKAVALDIGAYDGYYAIELSRRFERVIAYEPDTFSFNLAVENVIDSGANNIELLNKAVSGDVGHIRLAERNAGMLKPVEGGQKYQTDTIDSMGVTDDVALIKIDVEGPELEVVRGGVITIMQSRPVMIIETKRQEREIDEVMEKLGYEPVFHQKPDTVYIPVK